MKDTVFHVNGKPFFTIGAQAHNSSAYSMEELENVWKACKLMEVNTAAIAVSWERFEAVEGEYDTEIVKSIIRKAREEGLKLIFLWFGTWKNGHMKYVPRWVKTDHRRFHRVITHDGYEIPNLSSFCEETLRCDTRAFCKLMETIQEEDENIGTVLAVQVQNELGIVGRAERDYGSIAQAAYEADVPKELIDRLKTGSDKERVVRDWKECGAKENGNWKALFGRRSDEILQAYSMACYVDTIAKAGKEIYNIPMYTNVWLDIQGGYEIAGTDYPSGEAVIKNLAIWRWFAPHLDMICPDIYIPNQKDYSRIIHTYDREDNPLYIPETGTSMPFALGCYRAIAECGLTGIHFFGAESVLDKNGGLIESAKPMHENFRCLNAIWPLLVKYRETGKIHAVIQEEYMTEQKLFLDGWQLKINFSQYPRGDRYLHLDEQMTDRGRGLIVQTDKNEFYLCGSAYAVGFRSELPLTEWKAPQQNYQAEHFMDYLAVEEGYFDEDCNWHCTRIRNGDSTDFEVFTYPSSGVVRVVLEG